MKRLTLTLFMLLAGAVPAAGQTLYFSQDVPTDPGIGVDQLPWEVHSHSGGAYAAELAIPGDPVVDAIQRMDRPGSWIFSVEAPSDLAGALPATALPRDVIRRDGTGFSFFFCGGAVVGAVPRSSNVDAIYLEAASGGDRGALVVSFDVPTTIGGSTFRPADLVRYRRTGAGCANWQIDSLVFDSAAAGSGLPTSVNVIGADEAPGGKTILVFDVPADAGPSLGPPTYLPGQVSVWDSGAGTFDLFDSLAGWPLSSEVDALSCQANPGRIPSLLVDRSALTPGDLTLSWTPSCSSGAEDYAIYAGDIGAFYSHTLKDCHDDFADNTEELTPAANSRYYLVVATTSKDEGSYGLSGSSIERPQPVALVDRCVIDQTVSDCP